MSLQISGKARLGPDLVGRMRGSREWVKVVEQEPGQEKSLEVREAIVIVVEC